MLLQIFLLRPTADHREMNRRLLLMQITETIDDKINAFFLGNPTDKHNQQLIRVRHQLAANAAALLLISAAPVKTAQIQSGRNDVDPLADAIALQHFLGFLGRRDQLRTRVAIQLAQRTDRLFGNLINGIQMQYVDIMRIVLIRRMIRGN